MIKNYNQFINENDILKYQQTNIIKKYHKKYKLLYIISIQEFIDAITDHSKLMITFKNNDKYSNYKSNAIKYEIIRQEVDGILSLNSDICSFVIYLEEIKNIYISELSLKLLLVELENMTIKIDIF